MPARLGLLVDIYVRWRGRSQDYEWFFPYPLAPNTGIRAELADATFARAEKRFGQQGAARPNS